MDNIETGLYLPIRFYLTSTEQDRYKRHSIGVALTELNYPYVDCTSLAPFQMTYESAHYANLIEITAYCSDTNEAIVLPYTAEHWEDYFGSDDLHSLSYLGTDDFTGLLANGMYFLYVKITRLIGAPIEYYSDLFRIANCGDAPYETESFRIYSDAPESFRAIDANDLRIV